MGQWQQADEDGRILAFAERIARIIQDAVQRDAMRPSMEQMALASSIASDLGLSIPAEVLRDQACMRAFLRRHKRRRSA